MIVTENLQKYYGSTCALEGLTLHIREGEIFGLLGPNGAGKTTTIKILTTLTYPSGGRASIGGLDVVRDRPRLKPLIAVCPQDINLDRELTAFENLWFYGRLYRVPDLKRRINELLEWGQLAERAREPVKKLSGGLMRRLLILRALLSRPRVLFLDEPTVGLDPQIRRQLWDMIRHLQAQGITVLLTTHYIEEAESLCHRVAILNRGRLMALDAPKTLISRVGGYVVETVDGYQRRYRLVKDRGEAYDRAREEPDGVLIRQANLEDVFIQLTGERLSP
jgi:ABC-2 type transport system ATP-binding protein|uniref:ATP-binding cassette domain-containing protein n=1 Tax=Desulfobacca acetoxidans TaxID=60893 RepID=A0A7C5ANU8_9BACT